MRDRHGVGGPKAAVIPGVGWTSVTLQLYEQGVRRVVSLAGMTDRELEVLERMINKERMRREQEALQDWQRLRDGEPWPEYEAFEAAVAKCREVEEKYGLAVWAHGIPIDRWPAEYQDAVREWNRARIARNALVEGRS